MKRTAIINGTVVLPDKTEKAAVLTENGKIIYVGPEINLPLDAEIVDAHGMYVMPGFVEIHVHGGGGFDFMDCSLQAFAEISKIHKSHGTTSILPTTVACGYEQMEKLFSIYREAATQKGLVNFLGLHLEGPFISREMRGAQNPSYVRCPTKYETDRIMDAAGDIIRMCTVAPEIEGIDYLAKRMQNKGIVMSVGHSNGMFADAKRAYDNGFRHITHLYSNTTTVRKINQVVCAGVLEAAYLLDDMCVELIGDGHHVAKEVLQLALKIKGADYINLTSDAMRAAGTDATESYLGEIKPENRVIIEDGVAKLPDRSYYAGSITTGDRILQWAVNVCGVKLCDAVKMLSLTPASVVGLGDKKGSLEVGKDADILLVDSELNVKNVFLSR